MLPVDTSLAGRRGEWDWYGSLESGLGSAVLLDNLSSKDLGGGGRGGGLLGTELARARASSSDISLVAGDTQILASLIPSLPGATTSAR